MNNTNQNKTSFTDFSVLNRQWYIRRSWERGRLKI